MGAASRCELMDFKLKTDVDLQQLPRRLTAVLPEGIVVTDCYESVRKVAQLKYLRIQGTFEYDDRDPAAMAEELSSFFAVPEIVITKKTKRGFGEADIKPAIREIAFTAADQAVTLEAVISAQEPTLNPELLAEALRQKAPALAPDFARFTRLETYNAAMEIYR